MRAKDGFDEVALEDLILVANGGEVGTSVPFLEEGVVGGEFQFEWREEGWRACVGEVLIEAAKDGHAGILREPHRGASPVCHEGGRSWQSQNWEKLQDKTRVGSRSAESRPQGLKPTLILLALLPGINPRPTQFALFCSL